MTEFRLLIDAKLVEGASSLEVINPATGRTLTAAPRADRAQLDQAVAAAKTAFPIWSATPLRQRAVQPTIVRDIPDNARLVREEQFGPVLPVLRYSDIDEVIARANDTEFGLGGSVWSSDRDRAFGVAARLNAGTVWVNKHLDLGPDIPYAGAKQSGIGTELSHEGLEAFTQATIINMAK